MIHTSAEKGLNFITDLLLTCYESCSKIMLQRFIAAKSVTTLSAALQQKLNCK